MSVGTVDATEGVTVLTTGTYAATCVACSDCRAVDLNHLGLLVVYQILLSSCLFDGCVPLNQRARRTSVFA